jgi:hypothetical protein
MGVNYDDPTRFEYKEHAYEDDCGADDGRRCTRQIASGFPGETNKRNLAEKPLVDR